MMLKLFFVVFIKNHPKEGNSPGEFWKERLEYFKDSLLQYGACPLRNKLKPNCLNRQKSDIVWTKRNDGVPTTFFMKIWVIILRTHCIPLFQAFK